LKTGKAIKAFRFISQILENQEFSIEIDSTVSL